MTTLFEVTSYSTIEPLVVRNHQSFTSAIDSFGESQILNSVHYKISQGDVDIGYCSVLNGKTLTQFYLEPSYRRSADNVFVMACKLESVSETLVPTCDEFFLVHCLNVSTTIEKQAYFFQHEKNADHTQLENLEYRIASMADSVLIEEGSDGFFGESINDFIQDGKVFIGKHIDTMVAFGIYEKTKIHPDQVSIGMYTVAAHRRKGFSKATLNYLINLAYQEGKTPVAGCAYFNSNSRKALEAVGMFSNTRLLRFKL